MNLNEVFYAGHVVHTPELRYSQDGGAVAKFTVAYNEKWTDRKTGQKKEDVCFLDVVFFGADAENVKKYLTGGAGVMVKGKLRQENWNDKETGKKRSKHSIVGQWWKFTDSKPQDREAAPAQAKGDDDEIPF